MCAHCQHVKSLVMHSTKIEVKECHIFIFCKDKIYSPFFSEAIMRTVLFVKGRKLITTRTIQKRILIKVYLQKLEKCVTQGFMRNNQRTLKTMYGCINRRYFRSYILLILLLKCLKQLQFCNKYIATATNTNIDAYSKAIREL